MTPEEVEVLRETTGGMKIGLQHDPPAVVLAIRQAGDNESMMLIFPPDQAREIAESILRCAGKVEKIITAQNN